MTSVEGAELRLLKNFLGFGTCSMLILLSNSFEGEESAVFSLGLVELKVPISECKEGF